MSHAGTLRALGAELVAAGVESVVLCPGSRSTPLALALRATPGLRVRVLLDERSAGFFALGMARTSRRPVALVATSGTAAAEFGPAVIEASLARVPLVVLTADRPAELRDRGAPQTIDQDHLYGRAAAWFSELPLFDGAPATIAHVRSVIGRAVAVARETPGPVHLNVPFREPLLPDGPLEAAAEPIDPPAPFVRAIAGRRALEPAALGALAARLAAVERGLIVAGPDDDPELPAGLAALAAAIGWPIVADPLSGLRAGTHDRRHVVVHGDQLTRPGAWSAAHAPALVLRTGTVPTSKPLTEFLAAARPELFVLDGAGGWREASLVPATFIHADPAVTALALAERFAAGGLPARSTAWARAWLDADRRAADVMRDWLAGLAEPFEGAPFPILAACLPDGASLWAGNSMPVRDLDGWFGGSGRRVAVHANRGANGIDGVTSTALGSAAAGGGPVVLVVGDVSFLHDLGAFVAARLHDLALTIVLVNNDGGGIFSFLPQATSPTPGSGLPAHYEELFGTPHGIDAGPLVTGFGAEHRLVDHASLRPALEASIGRPGLRVVELRTDRARNVELHRAVAAAVARALAELAS